MFNFTDVRTLIYIIIEYNLLGTTTHNSLIPQIERNQTAESMLQKIISNWRTTTTPGAAADQYLSA